MPWAAAIPIATSVVGGVTGALQANAANNAADAQNKRRAVTLRYSPYTKETPEEYANGGSVAQGAIGGGLQGATSGMGMLSGLKGLAPETFDSAVKGILEKGGPKNPAEYRYLLSKGVDVSQWSDKFPNVDTAYGF